MWNSRVSRFFAVIGALLLVQGCKAQGHDEAKNAISLLETEEPSLDFEEIVLRYRQLCESYSKTEYGATACDRHRAYLRAQVLMKDRQAEIDSQLEQLVKKEDTLTQKENEVIKREHELLQKDGDLRAREAVLKTKEMVLVKQLENLPKPKQRFDLTINGASIASTKSDGINWDTLTTRTHIPPDSKVTISVGSAEVCVTGIAPNTLKPTWDLPCSFQANSEDTIVISVDDVDAGRVEPIGRWNGTVSDLLSQKGNLSFGYVNKFRYTVSKQ